MKKTLKYIVFAVLEIVLALVYGFFFQEHITLLCFLLLAFAIPCVFLTVYALLAKKKIKEEIFPIIAISAILAMLFAGAFEVGNRIYGEYVGEYVVTVVDPPDRSGHVTVILPSGEMADVDTPRKLIYFDDEAFLDIDDKILIQEWEGLFGTPFYVFIEEVDD